MAFSLHAFSDIATAQWMRLLKHPDVVRHMPLADAGWSDSTVADWVRGKDAQCLDNGYGPSAIRIDGRFAGWGGFQREGAEADFALVLFPEHWGQGGRIFRHFMDHRAEFGIEAVSILLPPSRLRTRGLARWGFQPVGEVMHGNQRFLKFQAPGHQP